MPDLDGMGGGFGGLAGLRGQGRGRGGRASPFEPPYRRAAAASPSAGGAAASDAVLKGLKAGERVRVVEGRDFLAFRSGMAGAVVKNYTDAGSVVVQFDGAAEPLRVA